MNEKQEEQSLEAAELPVWVEGIGPPLQQLWEDYHLDGGDSLGQSRRDTRALILEVVRLRATLKHCRELALSRKTGRIRYVVESALNTGRSAASKKQSCFKEG